MLIDRDISPYVKHNTRCIWVLGVKVMKMCGNSIWWRNSDNEDIWFAAVSSLTFSCFQWRRIKQSVFSEYVWRLIVYSIKVLSCLWSWYPAKSVHSPITYQLTIVRLAYVLFLLIPLSGMYCYKKLCRLQLNANIGYNKINQWKK